MLCFLKDLSKSHNKNLSGITIYLMKDGMAVFLLVLVH